METMPQQLHQPVIVYEHFLCSSSVISFLSIRWEENVSIQKHIKCLKPVMSIALGSTFDFCNDDDGTLRVCQMQNSNRMTDWC